jgi:saccharopine dehydrogenase-like NADP-dependent oxidoreductase
MRKLHFRASQENLCFVNEVGLDPGLDHLLAHQLLKDLQHSGPEMSPHQTSAPSLQFYSFCGGIPKEPNDFKYKFSWSPAGVLRALKNPAKYISQGQEKTVAYPWEDLSELSLLGFGETFEVYPNRDSTPYIQEYGFQSYSIDTFVRGTIRLKGWSKAWSSIFSMIPHASPEDIEQLSAKLWNEHSYRPGEKDRVVLYVCLKAVKEHKLVWSRFYALNECGKGSDTAMARLVSLPATFAIEQIEAGLAPIGVSGAPLNPYEVQRWLGELEKLGIEIISGASY